MECIEADCHPKVYFMTTDGDRISGAAKAKGEAPSHLVIHHGNLLQQTTEVIYSHLQFERPIGAKDHVYVYNGEHKGKWGTVKSTAARSRAKKGTFEIKSKSGELWRTEPENLLCIWNRV